MEMFFTKSSLLPASSGFTWLLALTSSISEASSSSEPDESLASWLSLDLSLSSPSESLSATTFLDALAGATSSLSLSAASSLSSEDSAFLTGAAFFLEP